MFCCRAQRRLSVGVSLSFVLKYGFRFLLVFLQVEPSNPMYGMPPSGTAAAPPASNPAYMVSHQYQRKCFTYSTRRVSSVLWGLLTLERKLWYGEKSTVSDWSLRIYEVYIQLICWGHFYIERVRQLFTSTTNIPFLHLDNLNTRWDTLIFDRNYHITLIWTKCFRLRSHL